MNASSAGPDLGAARWVPRYLRVLVALGLASDVIALIAGHGFMIDLTLVVGWFMARGLERRSAGWRTWAIVLLSLDAVVLLALAVVLVVRGPGAMVIDVLGVRLRDPSAITASAWEAVLAIVVVAPLVALLHPTTAAAFSRVRLPAQP